MKKNISSRIRFGIVLVLAISICIFAADFSLAYIKSQTGSITNSFSAANVYQINYDMNGGSGEIAPQLYIGSTSETSSIFTVVSTIPTDPNSRIFLGWADTVDAVEAQYVAGDPITLTTESPNLTLYAVWQVAVDPHDFELVFSSNVPSSVTNASVSVPSGINLTANATTYTFRVDHAIAFDYNAAKTGLRFLGWAVSEFGDVVYAPSNDVNESISVTVAPGTTTLYAVWDYDYYVVFERNVGDNSVIKHMPSNSDYQDDGASITMVLPRASISSILEVYTASGYAYTRENHMLIGFSTQPNGSVINTTTIPRAGKNNPLRLYAIWETGTFGLIYEANCGAGATAPAADVFNSVDDSYDIAVTSLIPTAGPNTEATFLGWADTPNASAPQEEYAAGKIITLTKEQPSKVLYGVWKYTYRLNFNMGHATVGSVPSEIVFESTEKTYQFSIPSTPVPERTDYSFDYWSVNESRVSEEHRYYDDANYFRTITLSSDDTNVTLYARMKPTNGVKLYYSTTTPSSASNMPGTETQTDNTQDFCVFRVSDKLPTASNYTFKGWTDVKNSYTVKYRAGDLITIDGDVQASITLYAVWQRYDTAKVTVNFAGGSYKYWFTTYTSKTGDTEYLSPNKTEHSFSKVAIDKEPTRSGYTFLGVAYRQSGTITSISATEGGFCESRGITGVKLYDYDKIGTPEQNPNQVISYTTNADGSKNITLTVYFVWGKNAAYDKYEVILDSNCSEKSDVSAINSVKQATETYSSTFAPSKFDLSSMASRTGYTLLGFARTANATTPEYAVSGSQLQSDIIVSQADPDITVNSTGGTDGGAKYTLTLYAVWAPKQVYSVKLYNGASLITTSTSSNQELSTETYSFASITMSSTVFPSKFGHTLKGFSYSNDGSVTTPDFPISNLTVTGPIEVSEKDARVTTTTTDGGMVRSTLNLYAVWEKQQVFRFILDYNGGSYTVNDTTKTSDTVESPQPLDVSEYTWSPTSGLNTPSRTGHTLKGFAYTADAANPVFSMSSGTLTPDITIKPGDPYVVESTEGDGVKVYTLTLYALWQEQQQFWIKLDANQGSFSSTTNTTFSSTKPVETQANTWQSASVKPAVPTRLGFKLAGYSKNPNASVPEYTLDANGYIEQDIEVDETDELVINNFDVTPKTSTLTLYAIWEPQKVFQLKISMNGGYHYKNSSTTEEFVLLQSDEFPLDTPEYTFSQPTFSSYYSSPSKSGNTFYGYGSTANATEKCVTISTSGSQPTTVKLSEVLVKEGDPEVSIETQESGVVYVTRTIYAIWGIDLYYSGLGSGKPASVRHYHPQTTEDRTFAIGAEIPTYESYLFGGWATSSTGDPMYGVSGYVGELTTPLSPTITFSSTQSQVYLYPIWKQEYKLSYNANGGLENTTPGRDSGKSSLNPNTGVTEYGFEVKSNIPMYDSENSREFLGWSTDPNATTAQYQPNERFVVTGKEDGSLTEVVLYAVWGDSVEESSTFNLKKKDTSNEPDGTITNDGIIVQSESSTLPTEVITPPAVQEWKYELHYDANGGDTATVPDNDIGSSTEDEVSIAVKFRNKDSNSLPTKEGYTFLGWAEQEDAAAPQYREGDNARIARSEADVSVLTLYAVWEKNTNPEESDEDDSGDPATPTDSDSGDTTPPTDSNSGDTTPPTDSNSGDTTPPADSDSGNTTPLTDSDSGNTTPPTDSNGGDTTPPADSDSGNTTPPTDSNGGDTTPPADSNGGDTTPPTDSNDDDTPAPVNETPLPTDGEDAVIESETP